MGVSATICVAVQACGCIKPGFAAMPLAAPLDIRGPQQNRSSDTCNPQDKRANLRGEWTHSTYVGAPLETLLHLAHDRQGLLVLSLLAGVLAARCSEGGKGIKTGWGKKGLAR